MPTPALPATQPFEYVLPSVPQTGLYSAVQENVSSSLTGTISANANCTRLTTNRIAIIIAISFFVFTIL